MAGKRHEYWGVLAGVAALLLLVCLISYDSRDTSYNSIFYKAVADNWAGNVGAHVSDVLYQAFGLAAFLFVVPMLTLSWKLIRGRRFEAPYVKCFGFLLLLAGTGTILQLLPIPLSNVNFMPGGVTGVLISGTLLANLNRIGTYIVVSGVMLLGLLAATTFSLQNAFTWVSQRREQSSGPGLWARFAEWRRSRKPVRTVVSVKTAAAAPALQLTPRPDPVKAPAPEVRVPPAVPVPQPESARTVHPEERSGGRRFLLPPVTLLASADTHFAVEESELMERARQLTDKCAEFEVRGSVTQIHPGPVVTTFEFKPEPGVKYSRITSLVDDLCLGIRAESLRIDRIPGKATVGIEVPNNLRETIMLREMIESDAFRKSTSKLTLALGKLINGTPYVTELGRMPHLLIAGATGSGKSVALNCMITSILYKATPDDVRFIFIDPKRLELGLYADIPHLLTPIVTDPKEAANALMWATSEMERRYRKLAVHSVRSIDQYNAFVRSTTKQLPLLDSLDDGDLERPLPYLVLVIDELADLMMVSSREVEESISRLAAMARAVGIHLILATQRPSVDVITGIIKANFPCRIAFKVATKVDSRTILDANGAEQLLGNGDMLFIPPGSARVTRIHGAYVSEKEAVAIVDHLKTQALPSYNQSVLTYGTEEVDESGNPVESGGNDPAYKDAVRIVVREGRASTSLLQRRLSIGYGRAAKLIDTMHVNGLVGPADGSKPREVLVGPEFLERLE